MTSQSELFNKLRRIVQNQMKETDTTYQDVLDVIKKENT
ncbi:hypothetical protein J2Z83_000087 [Virgibacillus natechei]|uniref:Uncharacterized protein n=1 Tax=Virgibacillus natechei TaxID=1216297 RepID=A0ABS4IAT9_9BACI|nr:hypothetical protein [Virgibacillus natechei]